MSAFSNIPPQAVLPLGAYRMEDLRRAAVRADQRMLHADFRAATDRQGVMQVLAEALALPRQSSRHLDGLFECLSGLVPLSQAEQPGFIVILENLPNTHAFDAEQRDALLDVFRDAADHFFDRKTAFRVFYSVMGKGSSAS